MKSLYSRLNESGLIDKEVYTRELYRDREKAIGFMWSGEKTIFLKDGREFRFSMYHHCTNDNGSNSWKPSEKDLEMGFRPKFVTIDGELQNATWHTKYTNEHVYGSKKGFFTNNRYEKIMKKKIADGSWKDDDDIHIII